MLVHLTLKKDLNESVTNVDHDVPSTPVPLTADRMKRVSSIVQEFRDEFTNSHEQRRQLRGTRQRYMSELAVGDHGRAF
jgi:hypothetical protein